VLSKNKRNGGRGTNKQNLAKLFIYFLSIQLASTYSIFDKNFPKGVPGPFVVVLISNSNSLSGLGLQVRLYQEERTSEKLPNNSPRSSHKHAFVKN
jgi:hypothetical protein